MGRFIKGGPRYSALRIAAIYAILGVFWILFSDSLVQSLASSESQLTRLQSAKGVGFIFISSLAIFLLTYRPLCRLTETNSELESALQHSARLHRILRHNLRNSCQSIAGFAELLAERSNERDLQFVQRIREQNQRLISLSRKSIYFHDFLDVDPESRTTVDLAEIVSERVRHAENAHEEATITVESPEYAPVHVHHQMDEAIEELLENAIIYNDSDSPEVWVTLRKLDEDASLSIADNGPGLPSLERLVLERKTETQTEHSQGLGLWLVYLTVHHSNGTLDIEDNHHGGTTIEITVPAA